jgi:hypothetical protein
MLKNELKAEPKSYPDNAIEPKKLSDEFITNIFSSACAVLGTLVVESITRVLEKKYLK